jgi:hypothetical protein
MAETMVTLVSLLTFHRSISGAWEGKSFGRNPAVTCGCGALITWLHEIAEKILKWGFSYLVIVDLWSLKSVESYTPYVFRKRIIFSMLRNWLEQLKQFGIFYFPNLEVWQLPKWYGKEKKG